MKISFCSSFFFFSAMHYSKVYSVFEYFAYQMPVLIMEIFPTCLELRLRYDWGGGGTKASKVSARSIAIAFGHFLASLTIIVWVWQI